MAQAGIQDSLLCSTATATAASITTTVSSLDTAGESSFSTLQTDSSLFASPALPVLHEHGTGADASCICTQQAVHQYRYDAAEDDDADAGSGARPMQHSATGTLQSGYDEPGCCVAVSNPMPSEHVQHRPGVNTQALEALKRHLTPLR